MFGSIAIVMLGPGTDVGVAPDRVGVGLRGVGAAVLEGGDGVSHAVGAVGPGGAAGSGPEGSSQPQITLMSKAMTTAPATMAEAVTALAVR